MYYRLQVIPIDVPPLRARRPAIPVLVEHFLDKHATRAARSIESLEDGVMASLEAHDWPGTKPRRDSGIKGL